MSSANLSFVEDRSTLKIYTSRPHVYKNVIQINFHECIVNMISNVHVSVNNEVHSLNQCCCGKTVSFTYSECVCVASLIQHALCMHHILSSVACLVLPYFLTLSHFQKKVIDYKMCALIFSTTFVWNNSHTKQKSARYYQKCAYVFMQSGCYSCQNLMKLEFS